MKKMTTLFEKTEDQRQCIDKLRPGNEWVLTNSKAYRKWDGTACAVIEGILYRRYDAKIGKDGKRKVPPPNSIACQEPDEITGHQPYWTPVTKGKDGQRMLDAFLRLDHSTRFTTNSEGIPIYESNKLDQTYEFCGPKVKSNPENLSEHSLIPHRVSGVPLDIHKKVDFEYLKKVLAEKDIEGIVFWEIGGDRKCKIRKTDFGIKRIKDD